MKSLRLLSIYAVFYVCHATGQELTDIENHLKDIEKTLSQNLDFNYDYRSIIHKDDSISNLQQEIESSYKKEQEAITNQMQSIISRFNKDSKELEDDFTQKRKTYEIKITKAKTAEEIDDIHNDFMTKQNDSYLKNLEDLKQEHGHEMGVIKKKLNNIHTWYKSICQTLYQVIEKHDIFCQQNLTYGQLDYKINLENNKFDLIVSSKNQPSLISGALLHPNQYRAPFDGQANARGFITDGFIDDHGNINQNVPTGYLRDLVAITAFEIQKSQAEDFHDHTIGFFTSNKNDKKLTCMQTATDLDQATQDLYNEMKKKKQSAILAESAPSNILKIESLDNQDQQ